MQLRNDSSTFAEDDYLRSCYMRELIQDEHPIDPPPGQVAIPKVIIQFWHDLEALPVDVRDCLDSWNPLKILGFRRVVFDDNKARAFIFSEFGASYVTAFDQCHHPAMRCDYFRLCYIYKYGGFYIDADDVYEGGDCEALYCDNRLKIQPLCYDTHTDAMISPDVFIGKKAYSPDWIFYANNNPLIAPPLHPVVRCALTRSTRILLRRAGEKLDIQSTTGPGNFTASLVGHSIASKAAGKSQDFLILTNWEAISITRWPLSYRADERNWRLWNQAT